MMVAGGCCGKLHDGLKDIEYGPGPGCSLQQHWRDSRLAKRVYGSAWRYNLIFGEASCLKESPG